MAGFYTLTAEIKTKGLESDVEGKIEFVEKDLLKTEKKDYGLIISTKVIEKKNEGNTIVNSVTTLKKNIILMLLAVSQAFKGSISVNQIFISLISNIFYKRLGQ